VNYAEAREMFFAPREAPVAPGPAASQRSETRLLRDAIEPIAAICWWAEPAYDGYAALGLDFLGGYVWSRACVMGEPDPAVVAAAFAVFEPGALGQLYDGARETCGLAEIRRARETGAVTGLREALGSPAECGEAVAILRRGSEAIEPAGRALFAGLRGLAWPREELGQLWHACVMLREARGDGHLAACVAAGVDGLQANLLTELWVGYDPFEYTGTRAWSQDAMDAAMAVLAERGLVADGALTREGIELRESIEVATDRTMVPAREAIGDELARVVDLADGWASQIIERGWFPPDPFKRAAG